MRTMKAYRDVDSYEKDVPKETQKVFRQLRAIVKKAAPKKVEEVISYGIPAIKAYGRYSFYYSVWRDHASMYPIPQATGAFKKELLKYKAGKGTLKFSVAKPLPTRLIAQIVKAHTEAAYQTSKKAKTNGKHLHYHRDGSLWAQGKITNGKMDGYWVWFRKDGSKMCDGHFAKGKQIGKWTTFDKKGRVVRVRQMK